MIELPVVAGIRQTVPRGTVGARRGIGRRLFDAVYGRSLVYNQCWEDPRVDRQALGLDDRDRALVITSGGCNALEYALTGAQVVAVDANPRQNHLLELKLAAIRELEHDELFDLFGHGGCSAAPELYQRLRLRLSLRARQYWDRRVRWFVPERTRGGSFYYAGTAGLVALAVRRYLEARFGAALTHFLNATTLEDQVRLYERDLRERLLHPLFLGVAGHASVLSLLGVPPAQRRLVATHREGVNGYLRECLDRVLKVELLRHNYFWAVYLTGRYSPDSCPEYLTPGGFARLKAGLVDSVSFRTCTVSELLAREREPFTAFVLLDHMDWLAPFPELLEEEWRLIFARAAPGARAIFRSGGPTADFLPPAVRRTLRFEPERAARLHRLDRVGTYGSFHIARLPD